MLAFFNIILSFYSKGITNSLPFFECTFKIVSMTFDGNISEQSFKNFLLFSMFNSIISLEDISSISYPESMM